MLTAERLNLAAFSFFIVASWLLPLSNRKRVTVAAIGAIGLLLVTASQFAHHVVRDWLPALLMPMVYWQAGFLSGKVNQRLQFSLQRIDQKLLNGWAPNLAKPGYRWLLALFEFAYLSCYVLVPMALGVLYVAGLRNHAGEYWPVVLIATYPCYAFSAFVPTHPPRAHETNSRTSTGNVRRFNLWIVRRLSTNMNTFPSAHVTATLGSSLALFHFVPLIGLVFVLVSIGIAIGAVLGRYHYTADVLVAAALTVAVYAVVLG